MFGVNLNISLEDVKSACAFMKRKSTLNACMISLSSKEAAILSKTDISAKFVLFNTVGYICLPFIEIVAWGSRFSVPWFPAWVLLYLFFFRIFWNDNSKAGTKFRFVRMNRVFLLALCVSAVYFYANIMVFAYYGIHSTEKSLSNMVIALAVVLCIIGIITVMVIFLFGVSLMYSKIDREKVIDICETGGAVLTNGETEVVRVDLKKKDLIVRDGRIIIFDKLDGNPTYYEFRGKDDKEKEKMFSEVTEIRIGEQRYFPEDFTDYT